MGLLDDAIRDHLELKRRHGADPVEVERIESEALSPARREAVEPADELDLEPAGAPEASEDDEEALADLRFHDAEPDEDFDDEVAPHEPEPEAVYEVDPQATAAFSLEELEAQAARDDAQPGQPRPRTPESADEPEAPEPEAHDELEQTPEFLEETPEHDRLWFEQKPPKDFDF